MDHLNEIVSIDSEWKKYKNTTTDTGNIKDIREEVIKNHFNNELCDLYLLINTYFENDERVRNEKFWYKNNQNKNTETK